MPTRGDQPTVEALLRDLAPEVLVAVLRRNRDFAAAEDAVQEALLAAATSWSDERLPESPKAWLIHVAARRLTDDIRSVHARRRREEAVALEVEEAQAPSFDDDPLPGGDGDDTLALFLMCCHPSLTPPSAIALTLRALGGLTTAEIAKAFLVPEPTMAQRISRAKQAIKSSGTGFELPPPSAWAERLGSVLHVLYLMFNEGYTTTTGPDLVRSDLSAEAIRLTRKIHALRPDDPEIAGLLALMLLTDARGPARSTADGDLVPLAEQDRSRWDAARIAEGVALVTAALPRGAVGPYQLQAAIAAVHDEAPRAEDTDWPQILALYTVLVRLTDNPIVQLNRAIAVAMVEGPRAGLVLVAALGERLADHHRLDAVRAHLLEMAGDDAAAVAGYRRAAGRTESAPEQRYLLARAARLEARGREASDSSRNEKEGGR